jgi:hypothetical protein
MLCHFRTAATLRKGPGFERGAYRLYRGAGIPGPFGASV